MVRPCILLFTFCLPFLTGCGDSSPPVASVPCHLAKGTLIIGDKPAAGATIILVPKTEIAGSTTPRPQGKVDDNGTFQLSTFGTNDGAPAGEYGLIVFWPGNDSDDRLNGRYDTPAETKQTVKIAEGTNDIPPIKLK